ncbi:MAG: hypothetical protein ACLT98_09175 [Eggerthellaceae bacterium]
MLLARLVGKTRVYILDINFGRLGFLVNSSKTALWLSSPRRWQAMLSGRSVQACISTLSLTESGREPLRFKFSVTRGTWAASSISVWISRATTWWICGTADTIVASATGSTAYPFRGGPLVAPDFKGLVVVPLAPHTLLSRSIVTDPSDIVEIDLSRNPESREASYFVDGEFITPSLLTAFWF